MIFWQTGACATRTDSVSATWRRIAGIVKRWGYSNYFIVLNFIPFRGYTHKIITWRRLYVTSGESITYITIDTSTDGTVIVDIALGIDSARSRTWIRASLPNASFIASALIIGCALWSTIGRRSKV